MGAVGSWQRAGSGGGADGLIKAVEARQRLSALVGGAGGVSMADGRGRPRGSRGSSVDSRERGGGGGGGVGGGGGHHSPSSITSGMSIGGSVFSGAGGDAEDGGRSRGGVRSGMGGARDLTSNASHIDGEDVGSGRGGLISYLLLCLQGMSVGSLLLLVVGVAYLIALHPLLVQCGYLSTDGSLNAAADGSFRSLIHCVTSPTCRAGERCRVRARDGPARVQERWLASLLWTLLSLHMGCAFVAGLWALRDLHACRAVWAAVSGFAASERCVWCERE